MRSWLPFGIGRVALAIAVAAGVGVTPAEAQDSGPRLRHHRLTVAAGVSLDASYPVGDLAAELRRNSAGAEPFTLFRAESEIDRAFGVAARAAFALTPFLAVEFGGRYSTPQLVVRISEDAESSQGATASERVEQYAVDVGAVYLLPGVAIGGSARPYVTGGGGYLRQLDGGRLSVETGYTIHAGAGVQYWFRGGRQARQRPRGFRAEARLIRRTGGIEFEDASRVFPAVSLLAFVGF